jgi:hypothetical protein
MPQLPTYTAQRGELPIHGGRRAQAVDSGLAGAGQSIIKAADSFLTDAEESESRKALVASSEIRAKYARALDDAALDGSDTDKLKEALQNDLSRVGDDFKTRRGVQSLELHSSNAEIMFDEQSNHIRVQRASAEAKTEGSKLLNSASALIQSNPGYLPRAEADVDVFVSTLKHVSPAQRAELTIGLKRELNMSAAMAAARIDPSGTRKRLDAGEWNLTPEQRSMAINKADTEFRAARAEDAYLRAEEEREIVKRDGDARDKHFAGIIGGTATRRAIMDDADLRPATREHLINYMEARAKERAGTEKKSDQATMRALWLRIHAAEGDPAKIYNGDEIFNAVHAGLINTTDANQLNTLVSNQKDENNRTVGTKLSALSSNFERAINADPRMLKYTASQKAEIANGYVADVFERVAEYRKEGKSPNALFDPANKDYIGSAAFMSQSILRTDARQQAATPQIPVARQQAATPQIPVARTKAEYDALPPGPYVDGNGVRGNKKGPATGVVPVSGKSGTW